MMTSDAFVLLAAVLLAGGLLWWRRGSQPRARRAEVTNKVHRADRTSGVPVPDFAVSTPPPASERTSVRLARCVLIVGIGLFSLVAVPSVASAHGEGEATEGYLLVQQALGHLAHDTTSTGIELAMEKVDDALATEDQEGVDVAKVEEAVGALEAGQVDEARGLLQDSITQALDGLPAATGNQTGTTLVVPGLPGRSGIDGQGWGFLVVSFALLLLGVGLAVRFRPQDTVGELRLTLSPSATGNVPAEGPGDDEGGRS